MKELLLGMIAMGSFVAGLFFQRFWRSTHDRFFIFFAIAFWIEALNRILIGLVALPESYPIFYLIRLISFGLILYALIDKNRPQKAKE